MTIILICAHNYDALGYVSFHPDPDLFLVAIVSFVCKLYVQYFSCHLFDPLTSASNQVSKEARESQTDKCNNDQDNAAKKTVKAVTSKKCTI